MDKLRKITQMKLFLPLFCMLLVLLVNLILDSLDIERIIVHGDCDVSFVLECE